MQIKIENILQKKKNWMHKVLQPFFGIHASQALVKALAFSKTNESQLRHHSNAVVLHGPQNEYQKE